MLKFVAPYQKLIDAANSVGLTGFVVNAATMHSLAHTLFDAYVPHSHPVRIETKTYNGSIEIEVTGTAKECIEAFKGFREFLRLDSQ